MTHTFRPAKRESVQLIIGGAGASGSGKTYSLLEIAQGLAYPDAANADELEALVKAEGRSRIAFVDTERGRALHYAPPPGERADPWRAGGAWFSFDHVALEPPFSPMAYTEIIEAADKAGYAVIILDSGSHEWSGEGGVLEMQEAEFQRMGAREAVKMASWIKPKMAHKKMVGRITTLRAHLLIALRAEEKVKMVQERNDDGSKRGSAKIISAADLPPHERWSPVCDKSFPFELTLSFILTPQEPGIPIPVKLQDQHRPFFPLDRQIGIETGKRLAAWAGGAKAGGAAPPKRTAKTWAEAYIAGLDKLPSLDELTRYQAEAADSLAALKAAKPELHEDCIAANGRAYSRISGSPSGEGQSSATESPGLAGGGDSLFPGDA